MESCEHCRTEVSERAGYETSRGEVLCAPCYFALCAPRGLGRNEFALFGDQIGQLVEHKLPFGDRLVGKRPVV